MLAAMQRQLVWLPNATDLTVRHFFAGNITNGIGNIPVHMYAGSTLTNTTSPSNATNATSSTPVSLVVPALSPTAPVAAPPVQAESPSPNVVFVPAVRPPSSPLPEAPARPSAEAPPPQNASVVPTVPGQPSVASGSTQGGSGSGGVAVGAIVGIAGIVLSGCGSFWVRWLLGKVEGCQPCTNAMHQLSH